MSAHTPGPWTVSGRQQKTEIGGMTMIDPPDDHAPVAYVASYADAHLICAAPELLGACKLALNAFERNDAIDWAILERAIAKAEGR